MSRGFATIDNDADERDSHTAAAWEVEALKPSPESRDAAEAEHIPPSNSVADAPRHTGRGASVAAKAPAETGSTPEANPNAIASEGAESETELPSLPDVEAPQPVRNGSRAMAFLALLAILYTVYFARAILLPVALAVVLSLLLRPVVKWLSRRRIPEAVGAALCLIALLVLVSVGIARLIGPAREWMTEFPQRMQAAESKLKGVASQFEDISEAKEKIEEIAAGPPGERPLEVQVQQPMLTSNVVLLSATGSMLASVGVVIVLTYFLLTAGDALINNILTTMPTFREKRQVVELIQNVQKGVSSYLFAVTLINGALGVAVALAMWAIGLPNPALWGAMAALLNFIPYAGALLCGSMIAMVSILTFDSYAYASLAPLVFFAITSVEGQIITPAVLGRHMSLNPIMVFLFLTFWGWMWGVGGAVLAVPILAITRIVCDQFERTRPLGTMLSG